MDHTHAGRGCTRGVTDHGHICGVQLVEDRLRHLPRVLRRAWLALHRAEYCHSIVTCILPHLLAPACPDIDAFSLECVPPLLPQCLNGV